ncbi:DUF5677 domain-containing protein [Aliiroseovarius crassostreae]|uniref:DUF5677 domain-containing protein n=1 Tax=Aliiroseovarius crassostreae TaxID=154981 RepID=UPI002203771E|nr:DUF5677 domain-containing protein [Aliiroseovarius crassostreae]UWP89446.1 hypothetical protein K3J57_01670 [Aliiroseovarius crassostreae]
MTKLTFDKNHSKENSEKVEFLDTTLWLLNRLSVELILAGDKQVFSKQQRRVASGLLISACSTGAIISDLTSELSVRTSNSLQLARTVYEGCLGASYILAGDKEYAKRAEMYSIYKTFRSQRTFFKTDDTSQLVQAYPKLCKSEQIKECVDFFEKGDGARKKQCYLHDRTQRIDIVGRASSKAKVLFQGVEASCFELASEFAHASFFAFERDSDNARNAIGLGVEGLSALAIQTVILSLDAVAQTVSALEPEIESSNHIHEAVILFYQAQAPESAEQIELLK